MKISPELRRQLGLMVARHVVEKYGAQADAARAWRVTDAFVSSVITGRKAPTDAIMAEVGIKLVAIKVEN